MCTRASARNKTLNPSCAEVSSASAINSNNENNNKQDESVSEDEIVEFPDAPADNIWHKAIDNESYASTQHWVLQADDDVCNSNYSMLSI